MKDVSQQHVMFSSVHTLEARFCWNRMSFPQLLFDLKLFICPSLPAMGNSIPMLVSPPMILAANQAFSLTKKLDGNQFNSGTGVSSNYLTYLP